MNETLELIIKSFTLLFLGASTSLAIVVYFRNKKVELENTLFKSRLAAIGYIQMEIAAFFQCIDRLQLFMNHPEHFEGQDLKKMPLVIDDQIYKCQAAILRYEVYFSSGATNKLHLFLKDFLGGNRNSEDYAGVLQTYKESQLIYAESAISALRKECGFEEIHEITFKQI